MAKLPILASFIQNSIVNLNQKFHFNSIKKMKYIRLNLTKVGNSCTLKTTKLLKEIIEDTNKWNDILCSWIKRHNIGKMTIMTKVIYKFNTIPIKILFFAIIESSSKIHMEFQEILNSQNEFEKEK